MTKGKTRASEIQVGYGLTSSGSPPANHDAVMVDVPTITPAILAGLAWIQRDTFNQFHDALEGTKSGSPVFAVGDVVQIYASDDITPRGTATLSVYDDSGAPVIVGLDDNSAKSITIPNDRMWPEGATPGVGDYLTIDSVGTEYSTGGGRSIFPLDLAGESLVVSSIELYRNGVIQQLVGSVAEADNLGPSFFFYDVSGGVGTEAIKFGLTYPPAQGEELLLRSRLA